MREQIIDARRKALIFPTKDLAIAHAAMDLIEFIEKTPHVPISIALSGGSTPKAIYQKIVSLNSHFKIPWEKIAFFWGDERLVPLSHPDSNYFMAKSTGLLGFGSSAYPMWQPDHTADQLALLYNHLLDKILHGRPIDYLMAGVGEDGHTLSLFPQAPMQVAGRVMRAEDHLHPHPRLTLTLPYAQKATKTVVYLFGSAKAPITAQILGKKPLPHLPAWHLGTEEQPALFLLDEESAKMLSL